MAYGVPGPFGLQPTRTLTGATWNEQTNSYLINLTAGNLFIGDPVKATANGTIQPAGAGDTALGVFMGCRYVATNLTVNDPQWYPFWLNGTSIKTGTTPFALIIDDPQVVYAAQISAGGNLVQSNMFNTLNWAAGAGNQATGQSAYVLDYTTIGGDAGLNFKLLCLQPSPYNAPNQAYNVGEGIINNHFIRPGVAGI